MKCAIDNRFSITAKARQCRDWCLGFSFLCMTTVLPQIAQAFEVGPVRVDSVVMDTVDVTTNTVTFTIDGGNTFSECTPAFNHMTFNYAADTLAENYFSVLLVARAAGSLIYVEYDFVAAECRLIGMRIVQ